MGKVDQEEGEIVDSNARLQSKGRGQESGEFRPPR
jgi:hypothetical protein